MVWVKICATTSLEDARLAVDAGADAVGFVFAESPRRVEPKAVAEIIAQLPAKVEKVGVFRDERLSRIREIVKQTGLTAVQLYGAAPLELAEQLYPQGEKGRPRIYCAFSMKTVFSSGNTTAALRTQHDRPPFDAMLVDSGSASRGGGTGLTFDWERARPFITGLKKTGKVIVAGGLTPDNVARAIEMFRPWGVDVATGVEREPGKKDPEKVAAFVAAARQAKK